MTDCNILEEAKTQRINHDMHGVIVIDKPPGKTSYDVIRDIKKVLPAKKIGHAGTLDPIATGVLPVCLNEATKLMQFFSKDDKEYRATMLLGVETDTLDIEGAVVASRDPAVDPGMVQDVLHRFIGKIEQKPPRYSAVKFKGKPLYRWTRQGVDVEPPARTVEIYRLALEDVSLPYVTFSVSCSKGTYIRSLCADIGTALGCGACLHGLRRLRSGCFHETQALRLEEYDECRKADLIRERLIAICDALPDFHSFSVDPLSEERIRKGQQPGNEMFAAAGNAVPVKGDVIKFISEDHAVVAIAKMLVNANEMNILDENRQAVKIMRVFNR